MVIAQCNNCTLQSLHNAVTRTHPPTRWRHHRQETKPSNALPSASGLPRQLPDKSESQQIDKSESRKAGKLASAPTSQHLFTPPALATSPRLLACNHPMGETPAVLTRCNVVSSSHPPSPYPAGRPPPARPVLTASFPCTQQQGRLPPAPATTPKNQEVGKLESWKVGKLASAPAPVPCWLPPAGNGDGTIQ